MPTRLAAVPRSASKGPFNSVDTTLRVGTTCGRVCCGLFESDFNLQLQHLSQADTVMSARSGTKTSTAIGLLVESYHPGYRALCRALL